MMLRVRERGDEVHIEVDRLAGRQQRVLQAVTECRLRAGGTVGPGSAPADVKVRAGADMMRIRLKGRDGLRFEASSIYRCLREVLVERPLQAGAGQTAP
jgi:hypothetical protein